MHCFHLQQIAHFVQYPIQTFIAINLAKNGGEIQQFRRKIRVAVAEFRYKRVQRVIGIDLTSHLLNVLAKCVAGVLSQKNPSPFARGLARSGAWAKRG